MPRCAGSKPDGTPCERIVGASQTYCFSHDPARKEIRAEWYAYHLDQAERLRRTMEPLIALHEARAAKLLEALEGDVVSVGEAGFTQREDVLQLLVPPAKDKTMTKEATA